MKVQNIQTTNFGTKERFITSNMKNNLREILTEMNSETIKKGNENYFESTVTKSLKCKNILLQDGRAFLNKVSETEQMQSQTLLTLGKTELVIDNSSGKIIDYSKPFFTTWSKIMNNLNNALILLKTNFNDSSKVEKKRLILKGFTEKGYKELEKLMGKTDGKINSCI